MEIPFSPEKKRVREESKVSGTIPPKKSQKKAGWRWMPAWSTEDTCLVGVGVGEFKISSEFHLSDEEKYLEG